MPETEQHGDRFCKATLPPLNREQVRSIDRIAIDEYQMLGIVLMENAGCGAAKMINLHAQLGNIAILCGGGNNGGDGYVIARHLQRYNRSVKTLSLVDKTKITGDASINYEIAVKADIPHHFIETPKQIRDHLSESEVIIDAMLGTGAKGPPRGLFSDAIDEANASSATRFAIDLPTGLDCDTGIASKTTFRADHTITFVAEKIGFKKNNADRFVGVVHVIDIGVPQKLLNHFLVSGNSRR